VACQLRNELFAILTLHLDHSDVASLFNRIGESKRSRGDSCKNPRISIERVVHHVAKTGRPDFHRPDFIDHDKSPLTHGRAECFDPDGFERNKVEPIFSKALRRSKIYMREYGLFTAERDDLESDALNPTRSRPWRISSV